MKISTKEILRWLREYKRLSWEDTKIIADHIEELERELKESNQKRTIAEGLAGLSSIQVDGHATLLELTRNMVKRALSAESESKKMQRALHNCVGLLDCLIAESGRDIEWGAEDPFRMGEWFDEHDLKDIEDARTILKESSK
jgi:hypothetical protein